jgi:hypothetical protein
MAIPRDRVCWYCARGQHEKCGIPKTCACRSCYASLFAPPEGDGFVLDCRPIPLVPLLEEPMTHARLIANARRARTIAAREQERGKTDLSVAQTRRMALSVAASQRALGACRRESIHLFHAAIGVFCVNCPPTDSQEVRGQHEKCGIPRTPVRAGR